MCRVVGGLVFEQDGELISMTLVLRLLGPPVDGSGKGAIGVARLT